MTQSQNHGFVFENAIKQHVFNLPSSKNDTNIHDISAVQNKFNPNETISIKTTMGKHIDCGDIMRFYNYDFTKKHTLIIIALTQKTTKHKYVKRIYELNYDASCHELLFGGLNKDIINKYISDVKSIPNKICNVEAKKHFNYLVEKKIITDAYKPVIHISPKVDSKNQRRVQCRIKNFEKTLKSYITYISTVKLPNIIRGVTIPLYIKSGKRVSHVKTLH
tara:strand:- start:1118 stop:1777 length:660 start_codon:yes stop_codon:yes gene_type:complete